MLAIQNDSTKCTALMHYADALTDSAYDYDFALLIYQKVNSILDKTRYPGLELDLYQKWALTNLRQGNYEATDKLCVKALGLKVADKNLALKANILNLAGASLQNLGAYKRALVYYHEALAIQVKLNNDKGKATVYQNMANIFVLSGDFVESDKFFDKAADIFLLKKQFEDYATVIGNKAYIESKLGNHEKAKSLLLHALKVRLTNMKTPGYLIDRNFNLGLVYAELKRWDSCFFYLENGNRISDSLGLGSEYEGIYYFNAGYCYKLKGDHPKAIACYKKALNIKTGVSNFGNLYDNIASVYLENKQYDSAFAYKELAARLADSIYKSELKQHIAFENKRVELLEKDYANEIRSSLQKQSLHELRNRNYLFAMIIILLLAFLILLFFYFRQYKTKVEKEHLQSELDFLKAQLNPH
ncbi:MAG: tetratricopeptide repeat protein, partial [Bacteroidia bacterium]|nr:tetratricopeptide repeat protein [Bacteroidia bacterium]